MVLPLVAAGGVMVRPAWGQQMQQVAAGSAVPANAMHWMQQAAEQSGPLAADEQVRANAAWHYYALLVVFFATTLPVVLSMRYCEIVPSKMW